MFSTKLEYRIERCITKDGGDVEAPKFELYWVKPWWILLWCTIYSLFLYQVIKVIWKVIKRNKTSKFHKEFMDTLYTRWNVFPEYCGSKFDCYCCPATVWRCLANQKPQNVHRDLQSGVKDLHAKQTHRRAQPPKFYSIYGIRLYIMHRYLARQMTMIEHAVSLWG